jgi:hypothetical protein
MTLFQLALSSTLTFFALIGLSAAMMAGRSPRPALSSSNVVSLAEHRPVRSRAP